MNKYVASKGAIFSDGDAQVYGQRIEELAEENNGCVTPEIVVQDAHYKSSPLHDHFDWDDDSAAKKWRKRQARHILGHIEVVVKTNGEEENIKAFHNVIVVNQKEKTSSRVYSPLINVMSDKELYNQIIDKAMRELNGWRQRYKQYKELDKIFKAIDELAAV
jgi:hypothetical protein